MIPTRLKIGRTVASLAILAVVAFAGGVVSTAKARAQSEVAVRQRDFGSWSYVAGVDGEGRVTAHVRYSYDSVADLTTYALANRVLIAQMANVDAVVDAQITLRAPLMPDEFRTLALSNRFSVSLAEIRYEGPGGARATGRVFPRGLDPLPQEMLDRVVAGAEGRIGPQRLSGVITAEGRARPSELASLAADPRVFLVDVTPFAVRRDLQVAGVQGASSAVVNLQPPFWFMERLGLANFQ